jgi:predicted methyltransferase
MAEEAPMSQENQQSSNTEKERIMQQLHEKRRLEQKNRESLRRYLADKKVYHYRGTEYYKVKDYKNSFYVLRSIVESLDTTVQEVDLERTGYTAKGVMKGFIKWDSVRETILLSLSKVRIYYKPYEIEEA